ncbi:MAG TPA: ChbG/HpnK family deacetylase [Blastocatellia bacterium]|nr:ChbG/HpnK family deacetylase [Blastocatellia bacterium]
MKKLIVNADDFGFTTGVNAGIVRAFKEGIVTSATIMANGEAFDDAVDLALSNPGLGVGCHLALVGGRPITRADEVPSLVDNQGFLPRTLSQLLSRLARGSVRPDEIVRELRAQVGRMVSAGVTPTHLDSHKHSHVHPQIMRAVAAIANEFGINCVRNPFEKVFSRGTVSTLTHVKQTVLSAAVAPGAIWFKRLAQEHGLKTTDRFFGVKVTGLLDSAAIRSIMESLIDGTAELMCHPGLYDAELEHSPTRLKRQRQHELEALIDPGVKELAAARGISLISYREL